VKYLDLRGELGEGFRSAISGTVVDNDDFAEIGGVILGEDAVQGLLDEALVIVSVDENADERLWHAISESSKPGKPSRLGRRSQL
jgi:hypothetical protein